MSLTHTRLRSPGVKSRFRRLGATGNAWFDSVVQITRRLRLQTRPSSRRSHLTFQRLTAQPLATSSRCNRSAPYVPRVLWWAARTSASRRVVLLDGAASRLSQAWYPLTDACKTRQTKRTGYRCRKALTAAYLTATLWQSTPPLFLECRAPCAAGRSLSSVAPTPHLAHSRPASKRTLACPIGTA